MKQVNSRQVSGLMAVSSNSAAIPKNTERKPLGILSASKALLSFALLLSLQLITGKANATALPTTGFSCSLGMTATSTCVVGDYATFGTSSTNYWQYTVSTSGYSTIGMSFHTTSSATGPTTALCYYNIGAGDVLFSSYSVNTSCATKTLSLPAACNNIASVTIKFKMSGGTGSAGTNRVSADGGFTGTATSFCSGLPASGTVAASVSSICGSGTSTLTLTPGSTGSDLTYQWYNAGGAVAGATNLVYTPSVTATTTYSVVTTCPTYTVSASSPATTTVTVNALPSAGSIYGVPAPVLYVGSTATLTDGVTGGAWTSSVPSIGTIDPISGVLGGIYGGTTTVSYNVSDAITGCTNSVSAPVNIVWPNTLALYAGHGGNSTDVIGIANETVSSLSATGFGATTLCTSGGLSGLTVNTVNATYSPSGPHVSYTITPNTGYALNINEFHVSSRSSGTGPDSAIMAYRIAGGSWVTEVASHHLSTSGSCGANTNVWYWTPSAAITTTGNVEVAIFPYHPSASTGTFQVQYMETIGTITSSTPCSAAPIAGVLTPTVTTACVSGYYFGTFAGDAGVGITYSWDSSIDGGMSWFPISGANNILYTSPVQIYSVTASIQYRVNTTCASYGTSTSNTAELDIVPPVSAITVTSGSIAPLEVGGSATLANATAGGVWSSQHFSVASIGSASGIVTGLIPGITTISYSTAGFGACTSTTTVNVIEPGTLSAYLGTGGSSTTVGYLASGITASAVTSTGFSAATPCSSGGISGLTEATGISGFDASHPYVTYTMTVPATGVNITGIHATVRASGSGAANFQIAYQADGGAWVNNGTDLPTDIQSCGVSTTDNTFATSFGAASTVKVGIFPTDAALASGTFQVNAIDITGTQCAANTNIQDVINGFDLNGHTYGRLCDVPLSVTPGGGVWTNTTTDAVVTTTGSTTADLEFNPSFTGTEPVTVTYTNVCNVPTSATITLTDNDMSGCDGITRHAATTGVAAVVAASNVAFYPNPATNVLNIVAAENVNVTVLSMEGKVLIDQKNATGINVSPLASGIYMIKVYDQKNTLIKTAKFTKE